MMWKNVPGAAHENYGYLDSAALCQGRWIIANAR